MNKKIYLSMCNKNGCSGPVHVVEPGDTLYGIAQKYHTRVRVLLDLNPFVDIYNLQPGDVLESKIKVLDYDDQRADKYTILSYGLNTNEFLILEPK